MREKDSAKEFSKCLCITCILKQTVQMDGSATVKAHFANSVWCCGTIDNNFEEERIPSFQITDVAGTIRSVLYHGTRSCCAF